MLKNKNNFLSQIAIVLSGIFINLSPWIELGLADHPQIPPSVQIIDPSQSMNHNTRTVFHINVIGCKEGVELADYIYKLKRFFRKPWPYDTQRVFSRVRQWQEYYGPSRSSEWIILSVCSEINQRSWWTAPRRWMDFWTEHEVQGNK